MQASHSKAKFLIRHALKDPGSNHLSEQFAFNYCLFHEKDHMWHADAVSLKLSLFPSTEKSMNGGPSVTHGIPNYRFFDREFCLLLPAGQADKMTPHALQCIRRRTLCIA